MRAAPGRGAVAGSKLNAFERILAALHEAALDPARWPGASALIDEALGTMAAPWRPVTGRRRATIEPTSCGPAFAGSDARIWSVSGWRPIIRLTKEYPACGGARSTG